MKPQHFFALTVASVIVGIALGYALAKQGHCVEFPGGTRVNCR